MCVPFSALVVGLGQRHKLTFGSGGMQVVPPAVAFHDHERHLGAYRLSTEGACHHGSEHSLLEVFRRVLLGNIRSLSPLPML
jgi:hypothetical protein